VQAGTCGKETPVGELGTKHKCFKCETKFYDLGRPQPICPSCGEDQNNREPRQILKRKKKRSSLKMEPDIHLIPEAHDDLLDHEGHDHEEPGHLSDTDEEKATDHEHEADHEHDEEYSLDKADKVREDDADGYGPD
jgi:hypothetical protein